MEKETDLTEPSVHLELERRRIDVDPANLLSRDLDSNLLSDLRQDRREHELMLRCLEESADPAVPVLELVPCCRCKKSRPALTADLFNVEEEPRLLDSPFKPLRSKLSSEWTTGNPRFDVTLLC